MRNRSIKLSVISALLLAGVVGCGETEKEKQDKNFFTSGNHEADQRADQQMAKQEQLSGDSNNTGVTHAGTAVVAKGKKSLYDDLGGADGISAIVDDFLTRALSDPRVNWSRIGITKGGYNPLHRGDSETWDATPQQRKALKTHMAQFLALATGGPTQYSGKEMHAAHANMHITNAEFDATLGDLKSTLDKLQIANQEQKELLSIVESTREQIVEER